MHPFASIDPYQLIFSLLFNLAVDGYWNVDLIAESFWEHEAVAILSIPVPQITRPDSLCWHYNKAGVYTVKSGYHLLQDCNPGVTELRVLPLT